MSKNKKNMEQPKIEWEALLRSGEYADEYTARKKGARILRHKLKGGFCKNIPRTKDEVLEIIASTGISDNPEEIFKMLCEKGCVISGYRDGECYTHTREFRLRELKGFKKESRYIVESYSECRY